MLKKVGRYEIKAELGRGGMATVYRAYDPMFEREVAVKVLPQELMHDTQFRGRFEREAKIIARLEHAAIVPVYDVGQDDNEQPYFVMRCMTGGSLSDRMGDGPLSLEEVLQVIRRVAAALDYAHSKGIIHRDLKPANILFDEAGEPYISDYGIAKLSQSQTNITGSGIIGTPTYMSPEQGQGEDIDSRSDIYSLGVIIYEMLSGVPPYKANTPLGVVFKHVTEPVPHILDINPHLPVETEAVIEKALAKNPEERFATAMDLVVAIGALARGESPDLDRTSPVATHLNLRAKRLFHARDLLKGKNFPETRISKTSIGSRAWVFGVVGVLIVAALIWGGMRFGAQAFEPGVATSPDPSPTGLLLTASLATDPPIVVDETTTVTPTVTPVPTSVGLGGADKIALVSANNIWVANIDGSEAEQLTNDPNPKSGLQWLPDGRGLVYIQSECVFLLDPPTKQTTRIVCFDQADFFEGFRVSPDGKQVAISVDRQLFVVPFDLGLLAGVHDRVELAAVKGCLAYPAAAAKNSLWSLDGQKLALMVQVGQSNGRVADVVRVMDVHRCQDAAPLVLDEFPGRHFVPENYTDNYVLPSFSWDGDNLFVFNTLTRNEGYGPLYTYDLSVKQEAKINPINGACCYRDAAISPDGRFLLFAFQDRSLGAESETLVYYVPLDAIKPDAVFAPITLPPLFSNPREKPQFALRPVGGRALQISP